MWLGKNTLGDMMKTTSEKAKFPKIYTNHQIRKTTVTAMHRQGFSLKEISNVTKHKNLQSLQHYIEEPSHDEKEKYSNALFEYSKPRKMQRIAPKSSNNTKSIEMPSDKENSESQPLDTALVPADLEVQKTQNFQHQMV